MQEPDLDWPHRRSDDDRLDGSTSASTCSRSKKSDPASECFGQSVGGWSTKIHATVDALGNPLRTILSEGQRSYINQAEPLLADYELDAVLADRGYEADSLIAYLHDLGTEVVIPAKKNRLEPRLIDDNWYKDRNKVERYFNTLKQYRRVAICYEKTAVSFAGFVYLASIMILLL